MLKKNWKNLFRKTILDRGYGYYLEGAVEDISRDDDVISATVSGTELYEVEIFLNNDEVCDMDCDCPYAEEEEWIQKREKVFVCFNRYGQAQLLCEEKLYDRLWKLVKDADLHTVLGYEDVLLPKDAAEILQKYSEYLNQAAKQASGRKAYQEWARLLKRMQRIEGGKELSKQIAADWRMHYKNRRAMMDELKGL